MEENATNPEVRIENIGNRRPTTEQSVQGALSSLLQASLTLLAIPVNMLPDQPRRHVLTAVRELTRGVAALTRDLADRLERLAEETETNRPAQ